MKIKTQKQRRYSVLVRAGFEEKRACGDPEAWPGYFMVHREEGKLTGVFIRSSSRSSMGEFRYRISQAEQHWART